MMSNRPVWLGCVLTVLILISGVVQAADAGSLAGTWNVSVSGETGSVTQTLVLQQDGTKISGTFKGPRQAGTIEGTLTGNAISFHVAARTPLDYSGTVDGDTMKGTLSGGGRSGNWTATRAK